MPTKPRTSKSRKPHKPAPFQDGEFKIESGVTMPRTRAKYPLSGMRPRQSFFVACKETEKTVTQKRVSSSALTYGKLHDQTFTIHCVTENGQPGVRVWRVK